METKDKTKTMVDLLDYWRNRIKETGPDLNR